MLFSHFEIFILEVITSLRSQLLITPAAAISYVSCTSAAILAHQLLHTSRGTQHHVVQVRVKL